jgi:hypothetical protein
VNEDMEIIEEVAAVNEKIVITTEAVVAATVGIKDLQ